MGGTESGWDCEWAGLCVGGAVSGWGYEWAGLRVGGTVRGRDEGAGL